MLARMSSIKPSKNNLCLTISTWRLLLTICFGMLALLPNSASAQVFNSGASNSALFDTVINFPADMDSYPSLTQSLTLDGATFLLSLIHI